MIARLEGTVEAIQPDHLIITIAGMGFQVAVPAEMLALASLGERLRLFTHLHVRENELALYGFATEESLKLFRLLLSVSGIGPRSGLAMLSTLPAENLKAAIAQENAAVLAQVPGVGPKTAKRIIFQLKDKIVAEERVSIAPLAEIDTDVVVALTGLGYSLVEAQSALQHLPRDQDQSLEERIRLALTYLGQL